MSSIVFGRVITKQNVDPSELNICELIEQHLRPRSLNSVVGKMSILSKAGCLSIVALLIATSTTCAHIHTSKAFEIRTSVRVSSGIYVGSGVHLFGNRILTAAHVVNNGANISVSNYAGVDCGATLAKIDTSLDLALLKVGASCLDVPYASIGHQPSIGELIYVVGFSLGWHHPILTTGYLAGTTGTMYTVSAATAKGNSGGGCYDEHGNIVGILVKVVTEHHHISLCQGLDAVAAFLGE